MQPVHQPLLTIPPPPPLHSSDPAACEKDCGTRDPATGNYVLYNFQCDSSATDCPIYTTGMWTAAGGWDYTNSEAPTAASSPTQPFRFSDNTQVPVLDVDPPPPIPDEEKNLLPSSLVTVGSLLVIINYCIAATLGALTFLNRKHKVIRASQPLFLYMVLLGCCISTTTIFFFGQNDDGGGSDRRTVTGEDADGVTTVSPVYANADSVSCMMQPFLYSFGFTFSFAALFAKVTRIVKIFGNKKLSRVTITWVDMMKPILLLLVTDIAILLAWSSDDDAKLQWQREVLSSDISTGVVLTSAGMCKAKGSPWVYGSIILALHFAVLVYGNYMCYKGRNAGTAFSESKYVFMAMVSNLQIMALGLPMLVMVYDNPTTNYFMRTGIVFFNDVGVMLLIFLPKIYLVYFGSEDDLNQATSTQTSAGQTKTGSNSTGNDRTAELEQEILDLKAELEAKS